LLGVTTWSRACSCSIVALAACLAGRRVIAQTAGRTRCDSVVAAARVDTTTVGLFVRTQRLDGGELKGGQSTFISQVVGSAFVAPRPLELSVFAGGSQMRVLRHVSDSALRPPAIAGVYRYTTTRSARTGQVETLRASLIPGFDSAAIAAIVSATSLPDVRWMADSDADSMRVQVRFSTDSAADSYRIALASLPRMPVVDASPRRDNPAPEFPAAAKKDSIASGEVVLRFVVGQSGEIVPGTVEVARASGLEFLRSALTSLPAQRFEPATIRGCPVAQVVDYSFAFVLPATDGKPPRGTPRRD
jgi:Gram-negative bacterial TonB protein C-terminal